MGVRVSVVVLACAVVALAVFAPATAKPAAACNIARPANVLSALDAAATGSEIVIVAEVIRERTIERVGLYEKYESTIRVRAVLKGNPEREITFSPLGFHGADCSGGPRLPVGERVLLFLSPSSILLFSGADKYVLANGEARAQFAVPGSPLRSPIPVDDALRRVAAITGATDEQLDAALAFALGGPLPELQPDAEPVPTDAPLPDASPLPVDVEEDGGQPALLIALASALLALLVAALAGLGLRRAR